MAVAIVTLGMKDTAAKDILGTVVWGRSLSGNGPWVDSPAVKETQRQLTQEIGGSFAQIAMNQVVEGILSGRIGLGNKPVRTQ